MRQGSPSTKILINNYITKTKKYYVYAAMQYCAHAKKRLYMNDELSDIQNFLEGLPDKYSIMIEGIDMQTQKEYLNHSGTFGRGELTEKETLALGNILFNQNEAIEKKKRALVLLAHLGTIEAFRLIEKYNNDPDKELKQWTLLSLQECKMFLESSLLDESSGFITTGLGGLSDRLRYYFFVLPATGQPFTKKQMDIVKDEFQLVCKHLNSILETINFSDTCIGFTILVPLDVALGVLIETGINKCNEIGYFVFEHYYATNQNIPDESEIDDIIKIIRD